MTHLESDFPPAAPAPLPESPRHPVLPWGPWATLWLALAVFFAYSVVQLVVMIVLWAFQPGVPSPAADGEGLPVSGLQFALATLLSAPVGIALVILLLRLRRERSVREDLGLRGARPRAVLLSLIAMAAYLAVYDLVTRYFDRPVVPEFMVDAYRTAGFLPALYAAVVLAAPLFEEILFRGFLLPGLARSPYLRGAGAVLLSSVLFALPHLQYDLFDITAVFGLGVLFAVVRLRTGSTWLAIGLHALVNLLATVQVALYLS
ncbi:MAG TPA: type II CAAX endopeptidase family protein [Thermoanaerobaculia bacterium]|nr:type II CAAX endopeptidase family protein [Thermoanaerobaculia bacterium]